MNYREKLLKIKKINEEFNNNIIENKLLIDKVYNLINNIEFVNKLKKLVGEYTNR